MDDIHNYDAKLNFYMRKISEDTEISALTKSTLLEYRESLSGKATPTIWKNLQVMYAISKKLKKEFKDASKKDIDKLANEINSNDKLTPYTKQKYLICLKRFYRCIYGMPKGQYPIQVLALETTVSRSRQRLPEDLLEPFEVKKIISVAMNSRDRCFVSLLFDLGCRIGELASIDIKHIEDKEDYVLVTMPRGKNGPHKLPIINSRPYILEWLSKHPKLDGANSPLFIELGTRKAKDRMSYPAMRKMLMVLMRRSGLQKPVNPHHWRHSAATLYARHFSEKSLDEWFTWGSDKTNHKYIHMSGLKLLDEYLKFYNSSENVLRIIRCKSCSTINEGVLEYCKKCNSALLQKTIISGEEKEKKDEKALEYLQSMIVEIKQLQDKGIDLQKFNQFIGQWAKTPK
ncbi:MAG: tyrosine-type recombinase/integrase [Candidatus Diapherotrites archaeon]|nr:tyrosine-type recombinase/integrase [Candidatus Diapherotrites archaeon]